MAQRVFVAKPQKVRADQFTAAVTPWDPYVCTEAAPLGICQTMPLYPDWRPHVHGDGIVWEIHDTDWIAYSFINPTRPPEVLTNADFQELYGSGPAAEGEEA